MRLTPQGVRLESSVLYKVRRGNSDTENFKLSGPLPSTNWQHPRCIQLLSTFQYDPTIVTNTPFIVAGDRNSRPIQKYADSAIPTIAYQVYTGSIGHSTTICAYEDCEDSICQLIPLHPQPKKKLHVYYTLYTG